MRLKCGCSKARLLLANLLYGETLAPRQTLIHIYTKPWLCVLKFLRENVLQSVGDYTNAGKTSSSIAQRPGKKVFWHLVTHPGDGLQCSGARGAGEDSRSMGGWVGGDGVGCFLCNYPRPAWSQVPTGHFLSPLRVSTVRLVTEAAIAPP